MIVLSLAACGGEEAAEVPERITGVVTEVHPASGAVRAFSVDTGFETIEIAIDPDRDYGFDLRHLEEHRDTGQPVVVGLEDRQGRAVAVSIEDG